MRIFHPYNIEYGYGVFSSYAEALKAMKDGIQDFEGDDPDAVDWDNPEVLPDKYTPNTIARLEYDGGYMMDIYEFPDAKDDDIPPEIMAQILKLPQHRK